MTIRDWTEPETRHATWVEPLEDLTPHRLVELYADDVWRFASSKLRSKEDAEDAAMETFSHAIRDWDRLCKANSPRLWLLGIARNKVQDALRKSYRRAESPLTEHVSSTVRDLDLGKRESLHEAMAGMPESQREILVLKYVNGLSTEEIGKVIRKSTAAANSLLQRARENLRERAQHLIDAQGGTP